jgi:hypothetical protein
MSTNIVSLVAFFLVGISSAVNAADDWAYDFTAQAKEIYVDRKIQLPCSRIEGLLRDNDFSGVYITIRDAAIFRIKSCGEYIKRNLDRLNNLDGVRDAVAFYFYVNDDTSKLKFLASSFDREAKRTGDHWTVDIFGFVDEWNVTGRRLVRHAQYADAVGAELLCSAIKWRRYLYGDEPFERNWFVIGEEENVDPKKLKHFYQTCRP